eukprot:XP_001701200.1 predicted protein [Chlamydomonas reinhardtii]
MSRSHIVAAALCCCAMLAVASASPADGLQHALQRVLGSPDALKALASMRTDCSQHTGSRALLATTSASLCTYSSSTGCDLNADFVTSLGVPQTDTQKLLAYTSVLSYNCSKLMTKASCNGTCAWTSTSSTTGVCTVSDTFFSLSWLRGKAYCAGSPMDVAITCGQYVTQSSCGSGCVWQPASSASAGAGSTAAFAASFTGLFSGFGGSSGSSVNVTGTCMPSWINDQNFITSLINKVAAAVSTSTSTTTTASSSGATSILGPIFDDLFGTCSGVSGFKAMLTTCPTYKNATTCNAASGCSWSGFGSSGSCDIGEGAFGMDLLMDPNDSWVKQVNNATATCTSKTSSVACSGAGNVNVDTSVYTTTSYVSAAQPSYGVLERRHQTGFHRPSPTPPEDSRATA